MSFGEQSDGLHVPKDEIQQATHLEEINHEAHSTGKCRQGLFITLEDVRVHNVVVQLPVEDVLKAIDPEEMDRWVREHYEIVRVDDPDTGQTLGVEIQRKA